jgi:hypothetical protein
MVARRRLAAVIVFSTVAIFGARAWGLGMPVRESQRELGLRYTLTAVARGDAVEVNLTIDDVGKLGPLSDVVLCVPGQSGDGHFDLYVSLKTYEKDGNTLASAQLGRDLARRAEIELVPRTPPPADHIIGWVWFPIPVGAHVADAK